MIDIDLDLKKPENYIKKCFDTAFKILKTDVTDKFINGPVNKSNFLNKKFLGMTEYISNKFNVKISNANILDLFSGSGSFGLECISRGANKVTFVENYKSILNYLLVINTLFINNNEIFIKRILGFRYLLNN